MDNIIEEIFSWIVIAATIMVFLMFFFFSDSNQGEGDPYSRPGSCHGVPGQFQTTDC